MVDDSVDGCDCGCSFGCDCRTPGNGNPPCRGLGTLFSRVAEVSGMTDDDSHLGLGFDNGVVSLDPWCNRDSYLLRDRAEQDGLDSLAKMQNQQELN